MRNRFSKYLESKRTNLKDAHSPATESIINQKIKQEKIDTSKYKIDEQESDGSAGAFSSTEELIDDE
jgi:hypothetical protein